MDIKNILLILVEIVACSHARVPYYYAESLTRSCKFNAIPCSDYSKFDTIKNLEK